MPKLSISVEVVEQIIVAARSFDAREGDFDPVSESSDVGDGSTLGPEDDNPAYGELVRVIRGLADDEQIDLVALAWIGRGTFAADEWPQARTEALDAHNSRTAEYLTSLPMLGDYLEEGLANVVALQSPRRMSA